MRIDNIEVEEYIPVEGMPTECSQSKVANLAILVKERQFDFWCRLDIHWILSSMSKWWLWN